jgi:hypothetical protein
MPAGSQPTPITLAARRAAAAAIVAERTGLPMLTAAVVVDQVDVVTVALLGSVGLGLVEIRRVAATIWGEP